MHLEQHAAAQPRRDQPAFNLEHRQLDDVGRGSLDRGVERCSLRHFAPLPITGVQVRQVASPSQQGRGVAHPPGLGHHLRQILLDPTDPRVVDLHQLLRLGHGDPEPGAQPVGTEPVGEPVVHGLDPGPHPSRDLFRGDPEDDGRHLRVEVPAGPECGDQPLVA